MQVQSRLRSNECRIKRQERTDATTSIFLMDGSTLCCSWVADSVHLIEEPYNIPRIPTDHLILFPFPAFASLVLDRALYNTASRLFQIQTRHFSPDYPATSTNQKCHPHTIQTVRYPQKPLTQTDHETNTASRNPHTQHQSLLGIQSPSTNHSRYP